MPIITTAAASPAPPPVLVPETGYISVTYYDPAGTEWPLTDPSVGWHTLADGVSGLGAAPVELTTDPHPRGGSRLRHIQPLARSIVWPLHVSGATHAEFIARWRDLARAFTRTLRDGPGLLEVARPDGSRRHIRVYYEDGFDGQSSRNGSSPLYDSAVLTLYCEDPYWVDPVAETVHRKYGSAVPFLSPFPTVSSGQLLGSTTVTNPGDVVVWPTWTITGPASLVTFTRTDTGESFVLNPTAVGHGNLLAEEQVTVRTDPPQVRYQDGSNWIGALDWPSASLWSLPPGSTPVTFQLDGSAAGSAVEMTFNPRFETA
jgi:hypothetical protein